MENVLKENTDGYRRRIAQRMGISSQALTNKLNKRIIQLLIDLVSGLKPLNEFNAIKIYSDIKARFEQTLFPVQKKFSLVETIGIWQLIFVDELKYPDINRWQLLDRWREIVVIANLRICELTEILEGHKKFGCV